MPYKISGIKDVVGFKINKVRALKNFSRRYVADKLSVNQSAYSDMENGKIAVSNDKRIEIEYYESFKRSYRTVFRPNDI